MTTPAHKRHDTSDNPWNLLLRTFIGQESMHGAVTKDNRLFFNAVFWILRTGAPWRDLPPDHGDWKNTHRRFCRWRGIATRYAKNTSSFVVAVQIGA